MQRPHHQGQPPTEVAKVACSKETFQDADVPRKIQQIRFGLQTPQEMIRTGVLHVFERSLYKMPERTPASNGVLDKHLGISSFRFGVCETCNQRLTDCAGHFGYIKLELPVFHIGYMKNTLQLLQCICKTCSRVLVPDEERRKFLKRFRNPRLERVPREHLFKRLIDACKRCKTCPYCGTHNGTVKRAPGTLKIVHEVFHKNQDALDAYLETMSEALQQNEAMRPYVSKLADDLHPLRALALFETIPPEDLDVLDIGCRPEDLLCRVVPVPPVAIRPSVDMDGASNEDDITMKLMSVIELNNVLRLGLAQGLPIGTLMENWDFLQIQVAQLINSDLPGVSQQNREGGRPTRGFVQRLKGKQGRFRGNLSGKRVDFSARTVISPDPNLGIHQVCVPLHMATTLTYPERITEQNLGMLKQRVLNGTGTWPGANFVALADGARIWLQDEKVRRKHANELKVGDVVERHLHDGDLVLFNRQPSLHRISIQAFRAVVRPGRTLRFNECCCSPFNADFDGDEMNLHLPQTEEARAEALTLMSSVRNLSTPKNGEIMIAATQDFLTCAFLITSKDRFLTRPQMCQLLASACDGSDRVDLPPPAIVKPVELWTGKQMFSCLVRPNTNTRIFVNLEMPEREYSKRGQHMCPKDGYVAFLNSELICGRLGKGILGGGKGGLYATLAADFSPEAAAACMARLAKMSARTMGDAGFSIGIDDVTPKDKLARAKVATLDKGYSDVKELLTEFKLGSLQLQPGCTMEETLEAQVTGVLNTIRETAGRVCMETLARHNSPLIMSQCGSKGSAINIAQMVACVGQQSVGGKRCFNGFKERTLPHFKRGDKTPAGKGFVANSFYSGLTPSEFFFHTMAGREGLVDTAVKTAETGYMSRRLMKALEDLYVHYDDTVRNAATVVVQFTYGDDGMDPVTMEAKDGSPIDLGRMLDKVRATLCYINEPDGSTPLALLPAELRAAVDEALNCPQLTPPAGGSDLQQGWCSPAFRDSIRGFLDKTVAAYEATRQRLGLPLHSRGPLVLEHAAGMEGLTLQQLQVFVRRCLAKYDNKRIEPGSTVGAVGAQSIGEPGTQMTLKTFHFAGVASMNVTLGVPRIKEIINGARKISTPIIYVPLAVDNDVKAARIVKGRLERTTLGQVAAHMAIALRPRQNDGVGGEAGIIITLDTRAIDALQLAIDANVVRWAILGTPKLKLKPDHIRAMGPHQLMVLAPDSTKGSMYFSLEALMAQLPKVIVSGISTVERAVISQQKSGSYELVLEGTNLQAVMGTLGVLGHRVTTNHVSEVERYLGIEAARHTVMAEIKYTMGQHGMSIDDRHTMLLADCMTYKGELLGITRFGIAKMKDSVLHTASFEKTADHLFDAAIHGRIDDVVGVSESIIMGIPMPTGTGLFKLLQDTGHLGALRRRPPPLLLDY